MNINNIFLLIQILENEFQNKKFQEKMTINYSTSSRLLSHQLNNPGALDPQVREK